MWHSGTVHGSFLALLLGVCLEVVCYGSPSEYAVGLVCNQLY